MIGNEKAKKPTSIVLTYVKYMLMTLTTPPNSSYRKSMFYLGKNHGFSDKKKNRDMSKFFLSKMTSSRPLAFKFTSLFLPLIFLARSRMMTHDYEKWQSTDMTFRL